MTTQEFAQKIKSKFSQYKDMDDTELVNKIVAKYPQYKTQIDDRSWARRQVTGAGKGVVSTLAGISGLGERGIRLAGRVVTPKKYEERLGFKKLEEREKTTAEKLIPEKARVAGEGEEAGFMAEQIAEFFIPIPGTKISKVFKAGKWVSRAMRAGETTAEFATRTAVQRGEVRKEDIAIGGVAVVTGGVVTKVGAGVLKYVPKWLMQKATGQSRVDFLAGKDVSKFMLEKKKVGTVGSLVKKSEQEIKKSLAEVNTKLKEGVRPFTSETLRKYFNDMESIFRKRETEKTLEQVAQWVKKDTTGIVSKVDITKPMVNAYKETVLRNALNQLGAGKGEKISLFPLILGGLSGLGFGGIPGIATAVAGYASRSTAVLSGMGVTLQMLKNFAPHFQKLDPAGKAALSQILQKVIK